LENAAEDYADSFDALKSLGDFFVVNVSSPNTPNLRQLQDKAALDQILRALQERNYRRSPGQPDCPPKPILVKVAPDLSFDALDEILELCAPRQVAGIVATNTTIARPTVQPGPLKAVYDQAGGLSGRPLRARSTEVVRHLFRQSRGAVPIIGVGGIFDAADAWEKVAAGASLVQVYTGLVYEGPMMVKTIVAGLRSRLAQAGLASWSQAVGLGVRQNL
jgi:dihydroorotate dehydrogenase